MSPTRFDGMPTTFSRHTGLDRRLVFCLAQGEWISQHLDLLFLGLTVAGKTLLSCSPDHAASRDNLAVRYHHTFRLSHHISLAHADGSYPKRLHASARVRLLVLDDRLRAPLTRSRFQDLLEILDDPRRWL